MEDQLTALTLPAKGGTRWGREGVLAQRRITWWVGVSQAVCCVWRGLPGEIGRRQTDRLGQVSRGY